MIIVRQEIKKSRITGGRNCKGKWATGCKLHGKSCNGMIFSTRLVAQQKCGKYNPILNKVLSEAAVTFLDYKELGFFQVGYCNFEFV